MSDPHQTSKQPQQNVSPATWNKIYIALLVIHLIIILSMILFQTIFSA